MFREWGVRQDEPLYYLKENPMDDAYPSMYQIYMECVDEYEAAMRLVGTMKHWEKLCSISWFMDGKDDFGTRGLKAWREDMRRRDESKALSLLNAKAEEGDTSAARAILQHAKDKNKKSVGRPRKGKGSQAELNTVDDKLAADILSFSKGKG
jgi:hypothetical protein